MSDRCFKSRGFTLIELILVMVIIAIITAIAMPSLSAFSAGRRASNTATQIIGLANFARAQAAAEGRTYRLYFDTSKNIYWLACERGGEFVRPQNENGIDFSIPDGVQLDFSYTSKLATHANPPRTDEQQVANQVDDSLVQPGQQQNWVVQNKHDAPYVSFDPDGRCDVAHIKLTDRRNGGVIEVACLYPTELFHVLAPEEMTR